MPAAHAHEAHPPRLGWRAAPSLADGLILLGGDLAACAAASAAWLTRDAGALGWQAALACMVLLTTEAALGLYRATPVARLSAWIGRLAISLLACASVLLVAQAMSAEGDASALLRLIALLAGCLLAGRAAAGWTVRSLRRHGRLLRRTVVVGSDAVTAGMADALAREPDLGLEVVEVVEKPVASGGTGEDDLPTVLRCAHADAVILGYGPTSPEELVDCLRACNDSPLEAWVVPRLYQLSPAAAPELEVAGIPLHPISVGARRRPARWAKRTVDITVAAPLLLLASPVLLALALISRCVDGRGVLFRQERVGQHGRRFSMLKLRSLRPADAGESAQRWSVEGDARMSPFGRMLRATSLDELPQLWNVVRGDMSLVGPRPERPYFVEQFSGSVPDYHWRHRAPAGLTGLAQVEGLRQDTSLAARARADNRYIDTWSPWRDSRVLAGTIATLLRPRRPRGWEVDLR